MTQPHSHKRPSVDLGSLGCPKALVDSVEGEVAIARSYGDAPEIDGQVIVSGACDPRPGDALMVHITRTDEYDLQAEIVDESELQCFETI